MAPGRLLVVQHNLDDPLDQLAHPLVDEGLELETWSTRTRSMPPGALDDYDGVLTLGALASVNDHDTQPWIGAERCLLEQALGSGTPTLGVCFGAQLLASVAGARVERSSEPEVGWVQIELDAAAARDPVLGALGEAPYVFQWHYESFGSPDRGAVVGRSALANQALVAGEHAWGLQFHIEVGPSTLSSWLGSYDEVLRDAGLDRAVLRADTRRYWQGYQLIADGLARAFARQVQARAAERGRG
jgi:GMP synthase-like glutamine amidotransferase